MANENRWAIYARRVGHKKVHPCAPSRGLYNCPLADLERYHKTRCRGRAGLAGPQESRLFILCAVCSPFAIMNFTSLLDKVKQS